MTQKSHIAIRIEKAIKEHRAAEYSDALLNLFPAMDATAKKRYPKWGNGKRMKQFVADEHATIWAAATGASFGSITIDDMDLPTAIYKFARNAILHDGGLDPRIRFDAPGMVMLSKEAWIFPPSFIPALIFSVVIAPENSGLSSNTQVNYGFLGHELGIDGLWGEKERIQKIEDLYFKR